MTGVDALARADLAWLAALAVGLAALAVGRALSRKHVERPDLSPRARRLVDAVSGRALRSAAGHLAELSRFPPGDARLDYVRVDLVFDDGFNVTLDELCAQAGLAPLPLLEPMPDELDIPLDAASQ